jgi:transcriptional regulator with XRE-family HTH domain
LSEVREIRTVKINHFGKSSEYPNLEGDSKMSEFIAKMLKEARVRAGFTQDEAAKLMNLKKTTMSEMEAGKRSISADELAQFSRIYEVDVRELLFLEFTEAGEEQRLAAKYSSFFKLLEKLSDRDIEDVYWVIKRKVEGLL